MSWFGDHFITSMLLLGVATAILVANLWYVGHKMRVSRTPVTTTLSPPLPQVVAPAAPVVVAAPVPIPVAAPAAAVPAAVVVPTPMYGWYHPRTFLWSGWFYFLVAFSVLVVLWWIGLLGALLFSTHDTAGGHAPPPVAENTTVIEKTLPASQVVSIPGVTVKVGFSRWVDQNIGDPILTLIWLLALIAALGTYLRSRDLVQAVIVGLIGILIGVVWMYYRDSFGPNISLPYLSGWGAQTLPVAVVWALIAGLLVYLIKGNPIGAVVAALLVLLLVTYWPQLREGYGGTGVAYTPTSPNCPGEMETVELNPEEWVTINPEGLCKVLWGVEEGQVELSDIKGNTVIVGPEGGAFPNWHVEARAATEYALFHYKLVAS